MHIFRFIIEVLITEQESFKAPQAGTKNRIITKYLHPIPEECAALYGVLIGQKPLEAVGDKAGQKRISQVERMILVSEQGDFFEPCAFRRSKSKVNNQGILRYSEYRLCGRTGIQRRTGVHDRFPFILRENTDIHVSLGSYRKRIIAAVGITGTAQELPLGDLGISPKQQT